jgi:hypothetical protein
MNRLAPPTATITVITATGGGALLGLLIGRDAVWTTVGALLGLGTAALIVIMGVRPVVAIPVALGGGIGAFVGGSIVGVLCEPGGCAVFEAAAATITGIGALVGIGLVVALVTRSFDEYYETRQQRSQPPK